MVRSTARRVVPLLLALLCVGVGAASAPAATSTLQPSPAEARTFATTNGGWSSAVDYNGLVCIPGVTCPAATPSYQTTGGAGGAGDGYLRNTFGTLLGVLSTTTINWTSPSFVAPSSTDSASLRFKIRPQIASLLAIGSVNVTATIVDVDTPGSSTVVANVPVTAASASFSELSANVPTSAVVAGRTYRVRIGTALTTAVSAVTTGNLDIDDVVLELVDGNPPTGLTGSIPLTGPTRVVGNVDAAGLDTNVTVEYGLTTAYGTTTAPVTISGATSGSQPYTVPLTGLTPGATYNYRVTATNADGSVSTANATFVAPTPPSNAVPTVTGAGSSPTRTVTYARGADVTSATIEVLNGGGTVIDTVPDTDADGSVTITLPADGTYGVRVVRTNATGQSSTSATVPAVLDRVAPDVSALNLTVTPTTSPATTRTVSFTRPSDAASVIAEVIDADGFTVGSPTTVAGGSGSVTLGATDGAYRVRLTLTDASGNAAVVTSDPVTLDRAAPDAGPAPTVTGDGNSRARTVTFTRDPTTTTATVEVLGGGTVIDTIAVPSGASAAITLPDQDGSYGVRVRQADAAGNAATTPTTSVSLDRSAPDVSALALTVTPAVSNERNRTVTIVRPADAATVTAQVIDAAGDPVGSPVTIAGTTGTVTLGTADGSYRVRVTVADAAGNASNVTSSSVTLDAAAPDAGPAPTVTGDGNSRTRTVTFTRDPTASTVAIEILGAGGTVIDTIPVASGASGTITLPDQDGSYGVRVRQTDAAGNTAATPTTDVTLDRVAPDLSALALTVTPAIANERDRTVTLVRPAGAATITAQVIDAAGDPVGSPLTIAGTTGTVTLGNSDGAYSVRVTVADAAGNSDSATSGPVTLDTAAPDAGPAPNVSGADTSRQRTVTFTRDPSATTVVVEILDAGGAVIDTVPVPSGNSATVTLPDTDGTYGVRIRQTDAAGNSAASPTSQVSLDQLGPDPGPAPVLTGTPDAVTATFQRAPDAASATIEIRDSGGNLVQSVPVPTGNSATFALPAGLGAYTVRVVQTDASGNGRATPTATVERKAPRTPGDGGGGGGAGGGSGGSGGGQAVPPGTTTPTACAKPVVLLTRVALKGRRVQIGGWTTRPSGTEVRISDLGGKKIGTAKVSGTGTFSVTAAAPGTAAKRARVGYRAVIGRQRSPAVKLRRVNTLSRVTQSGTTVTLRGRVGGVRKLGRVTSVAAYGGTGNCPTINKRLTTIGAPKLDRRTGAYTLRVRVPEGATRLLVKTRVTVGGGNYHSTHVVR